MGATENICNLGLFASYTLLIVPVAILMWYRIPVVGSMLIAVARMTVQLLLVGFYLGFVFDLNNAWLNFAWLAVMIIIADLSVLRGCGLRMRPLVVPLFIALVLGMAIPLMVFEWLVLYQARLMDARYLIPLSGMILGNCLRADIVAIRTFYTSVRTHEKTFLNTLGQGATLRETIRPYLREAIETAVVPTIATIATTGLVSLPGMMTGVILGGNDPMLAIKYQIVIMLSILAGTTITIALAILMTVPKSFTPYGMLDHAILTQP